MSLSLSSLSYGVPMHNDLSTNDINTILNSKRKVLCSKEGYSDFQVYSLIEGFLVTDDEDYFYWVATEEEAIALWCEYQEGDFWKEVAHQIGLEVTALALHHLPNWEG